MKLSNQRLATAARVLLGLVMFVFGLNFFIPFLPQPPLAGAAGAFLGALVASGYVLPIVKSVEVVTGLLLLSNSFVPLALTLLAPIVVGIVGFHLSLDPAGSVPGLVVLALGLSLAYFHRSAFAPLFQRTSPVAQRARSSRDVPKAGPAAARAA